MAAARRQMRCDQDLQSICRRAAAIGYSGDEFGGVLVAEIGHILLKQFVEHATLILGVYSIADLRQDDGLAVCRDALDGEYGNDCARDRGNADKALVDV